jgi:hypothetical protein
MTQDDSSLWEWWKRPLPEWKRGKLILKNIARDESVVITLRAAEDEESDAIASAERALAARLSPTQGGIKGKPQGGSAEPGEGPVALNPAREA